MSLTDGVNGNGRSARWASRQSRIDSADPRGGELQDHPLRHVRGPQRHVFAFANAERQQPLSRFVD